MGSRRRSLKFSPSVYIGGDFVDAQLLWIIPVVHGYCRGRGIGRLVFQRGTNDLRENSENLRKVLGNYEILVDENSASRHTRFGRGVRLVLSLGLNVPFRLARLVSRDRLLNGTSNFTTQILHSVWDHALQAVPDGTIKISMVRRFISSLAVLAKESTAKRLVKDDTVVAALLGHGVYA